MGPGTPVQLEEMLLVLDTEEQAKENEEEARRQREQQEHFQHPTDSVDSEDFDDMQEKWDIANLTRHVNDLSMGQSEAIGVWTDMAKVTSIYNRSHPNQQIMVQAHFPELFDYLAAQLDMLLTNYELDMGKQDQQDAIKACEAITMDRLEEQEDRVQLPADVQQYMFPESGPGTRRPEEDPRKIVHSGVQILRYEQGLLNTVLAEADHGESDLMDNHNTLFLKGLLDLQVYTNIILLEQVADLVRWKMIGQLPKTVWEKLQLFQFGDGEETL